MALRDRRLAGGRLGGDKLGLGRARTGPPHRAAPGRPQPGHSSATALPSTAPATTSLGPRRRECPRECPREPEREPARRVLAGARIRRDRALEPWTVAASARKHEPRPINVDQPHGGGLYVAQRIGSPWSSHTASKTSGAPTGSCTVSRIRTSRSSVGSMLSRTTPLRPSSARSIAAHSSRVDVLAHDRMPDDGQLIGVSGVERLREPLRGRPRRHPERDRARRRTGRRACDRSGAARRARCRRAA